MSSANVLSIYNDSLTTTGIAAGTNSGGLTGTAIQGCNVGTGGNSTSGYWINGSWYTYYQPYISYPIVYSSPAPNYELQIRKVENGWILLKDGKEFLITKPEQIVKYLTKEKVK